MRTYSTPNETIYVVDTMPTVLLSISKHKEKLCRMKRKKNIHFSH